MVMSNFTWYSPFKIGYLVLLPATYANTKEIINSGTLGEVRLTFHHPQGQTMETIIFSVFVVIIGSKCLQCIANLQEIKIG